MFCCNTGVNEASEEVLPTAAEVASAEQPQEDKEIEAEIAPQEPTEPKKEAPKEEPTEPKKEALEGQSQTFEYTLDTAKEAHGMVADPRGETLIVASLGAGAAQKQDMQVNDFIVEVNGKTDLVQMLEELKVQGASLKIKVQRPVPFEVSVTKGGKLLGLRLAYVSTSTTVSITEVLDGAVADYNKDAAPGKDVKVKDRILSVGGVAGNATKMVEALKASDTLVLTIARLAL